MQFEGPNTASYSPSSTLVESLASCAGVWGWSSWRILSIFDRGRRVAQHWLKPVLLLNCVACGRPVRAAGVDESRCDEPKVCCIMLGCLMYAVWV